MPFLINDHHTVEFEGNFAEMVDPNNDNPHYHVMVDNIVVFSGDPGICKVITDELQQLQSNLMVDYLDDVIINVGDVIADLFEDHTKR